MIDITPVFNAIIALAASLITAFLIPYIKANTTAKQRETLEAVVKSLVMAAEQIYVAGSGPDKLDWVKKQLASRGFTIDIETIEAAVRQYIHPAKPPDTATILDQVPDLPF